MSAAKEITEKTEAGRKNVTVFGAETEFDGDLEFSDSLIIMGKFNGRIRATGDLEIARGAVCTVKGISARSVVISGSVTGSIEASASVELCSGASVTGDIVTARLRIADNVNFEGQVTMLDKEPDENIFSTASAEYKQALVLHSDRIG